MIKHLNGTKEIVEFEGDSILLCYDNTDYEAYPPHWHTALEIVMPLEGIYEIECGGRHFCLNERDVMIIPPGSLHGMYAERGRRIIFQAGFTLISAFKELESYFSLIQPAIVITPAEYPLIHDELANLMNEIMDEYFSNTPMKETSICAKCIYMLVQAARSHTMIESRFPDARRSKQGEYVEKFVSICNYINDHCTEELTLESVAETAGFSKYHFSRLFKEFTDITFYKYLNMRRISYAEKLLMDPDISVMDAAVKSGFNSLSAFIRMFKIVKGCTPTEFRTVHDDLPHDDSTRNDNTRDDITQE